MNVFRPWGGKAHFTVWVFKNQKTADEKLQQFIHNEREKTPEINTGLRSQFKRFHRTLSTVSGWESLLVSAKYIV